MKFSSSAILLAACAVGEVAAATFMPKHNHAARHVEAKNAHAINRASSKRNLEHLDARAIKDVLAFGLIAPGENAVSNNGAVWIGSDGLYTNEFFNQGAEDLILVVWGNMGSWVNAVIPLITVTIPSNSSKVLSFADNQSGAWAPIYSNSQLVMGQISETWGEFTFAGQDSTVDVSREVNYDGHTMSIVTPKCISDMKKCVFVCANNAKTCMVGYTLLDCENGSQPGATKGQFMGTDSGGCSHFGGSTGAKLQTYLNWAYKQ